MLGKLFLLATKSPLFILMAIFRIGSLVTGATWVIWSDGSGSGPRVMVALLVVLALPLLPSLATLLMLRCCGKLEDVGGVSILQGAMAAITTLSMWGSMDRQRNKNTILTMSTFLLLLYSILLVWSMAQPFIWIPDFWTTRLSETWFNAWVARRQAAAIGFLCCGWVSFPILGCLLFDIHPLSYCGQHMGLVHSPSVTAVQPPLAMF